MNVHAIRAIYRFEMARTGRTLLQSIVSPVISTSLYFVVFGAAIGSRIAEIGGVSYGAFIVPGLIMLSLLTQSISNASFGIYFPKFTGTIYELLSAPVSTVEIVVSYVDLVTGNVKETRFPVWKEGWGPRIRKENFDPQEIAQGIWAWLIEPL